VQLSYSGDLSRTGAYPLNETTYGQALRFVLFLGAAMHDANTEQRKQLREKVNPLLERYRVTGHEVLVRIAVRDVMGQDWRPSGDWKKQIDLLRDKEDKR
jgi:hypothetical protein